MRIRHIISFIPLLATFTCYAGAETKDVAEHLSTIDRFEQQLKANREAIALQKQPIKPQLTAPSRADGFIIADKYYHDGPYLKFCETGYGSTDGIACASLDVKTKQVKKHLAYTAQEYLDLTFGQGITQFTSIGWKEGGVIIYYAIAGR